MDLKNICNLHVVLIHSSFSEIEKYLRQSILEKEALACFACLSAACNANVVKNIVPFFMNSVEDTIGNFDSHLTFIDKVFDFACAFNTSCGPLLLKDLHVARIRRNRNDHAYVYLRRKARRRWNTVVAAVICRCMFFAWMRHRLRPDGPYMKRYCVKAQQRLHCA